MSGRSVDLPARIAFDTSPPTVSRNASAFLRRAVVAMARPFVLAVPSSRGGTFRDETPCLPAVGDEASETTLGAFRQSDARDAFGYHAGRLSRGIRCRANAVARLRPRRRAAPRSGSVASSRCTTAPRFTSRHRPSHRRLGVWRTAGSTSGTRATGRRCTRRPSRTPSGRRRPRPGYHPRSPRAWRVSRARR